jgi:hypothetical protein
MVDNSIFRLEVEEIREPNDHNMSFKKIAIYTKRKDYFCNLNV